MIVGVGIDLEETSRIRDSIDRFGDRFLDKIFTASELAFCKGKANAVERFAARFAAKEAAFKALQATWSDGLTWRDFEVLNSAEGAPRLELHGQAEVQARARGVSKTHLSFSHTKHYVTAVVVLEA